MDSYKILNAWDRFCSKNPRLIKPMHHAILLHAITVCNRLHWPPEFQFPTDAACQFIGIVDRETFTNGLKGLIEFGAIREVQPARGLHVARFVSFIDAPLYLPIKPAGESDAKPEKKKRTQPTVSPFVDNPPNEQEVAAFFTEKGGESSFAATFARQFIAHYSLNNWTYGTKPLKSWKHAVSTWDPRSWRPRSVGNQDRLVKPAIPPLLIEER